jgi:tRNA dimethylallyltransferase
MSAQNPLSPLIAIVGPTASGKSALGVWLAEQLGGEVVACDSTQLYQGFDIGTAKPSASERQRIAHHLIDVLAPREDATAGGYREKALQILQDLRQRDRLPVLTVGTGLYLRALLEGFADLPVRSEALRSRLRASSQRNRPEHLHRMLRRLDPEAATKIASQDEQKLIRAIEVCLLAKRPLSEVHRTGRAGLPGWQVLKIGLIPPREMLYSRIHARTETMLAQGWLHEVRALLGSGLAESAKPFDFIGYRELRAVLGGQMTVEQARTAIQQATRQYAKRQLTWFRKDAAIKWFTGFGDETNLQCDALEFLRGHGLDAGRSGKPTSV